MSTDRNVERVKHLLDERAARGLSKYGVTTERDDLGLDAWLQHIEEELADALVYIQAARQKLKSAEAAARREEREACANRHPQCASCLGAGGHQRSFGWVSCDACNGKGY